MKRLTNLMMAALLTGCGTTTLLTSCTTEDNAIEEATTMSYGVDGFSDAEGKTVFLYNMNSYECVGTATVTDGQFHFSGTADKDAFMSIVNDTQDWAIPFFNDGIAVTVNLSDTTLTGSPFNERAAALDKEVYGPMNALRAEFNKLTPLEQIINRSQFSQQMSLAKQAQNARIDQIYIDERNNYIPVIFTVDYLTMHGLEAYDQLVAEGAYFASHPAFKTLRDLLEAAPID